MLMLGSRVRAPAESQITITNLKTMYICLGQDRTIYRNTIKTDKVAAALVRADVTFNEDCTSVIIHNIKRSSKAKLQDVVDLLYHVVIYGRMNSRIGVKTIVCETSKVANSILHRVGFETSHERVFSLVSQ